MKRRPNNKPMKRNSHKINPRPRKLKRSDSDRMSLHYIYYYIVAVMPSREDDLINKLKNCVGPLPPSHCFSLSQNGSLIPSHYSSLSQNGSLPSEVP
jgi:hypothetical protein